MLGEIHTGLDGDDVTGCERSSRRPRDPRVLVDLEADAVAGAVGERVGPTGLADDDRQASSTALVSVPAATAATPAACAAVTTSSIRRCVAEGSPMQNGAGHVGAVAVDQRAEVDDHEVALLDPAVRAGGAVVGLGAVRPGGDDRLERRCPRRRGAGSRCRARARSRSRSDARTAGAACSGAPRWRSWRRPRCGRPRRRPSPGAAPRRPVGRPPARVAGGTTFDHCPLLRPRHVVGLEPEAKPDAAPSSDAVLLLGGEPDAHAGIDAGRRQLLGRLVAVAAVGDEQQLGRAARAAARPSR